MNSITKIIQKDTQFRHVIDAVRTTLHRELQQISQYNLSARRVHIYATDQNKKGNNVNSFTSRSLRVAVAARRNMSTEHNCERRIAVDEARRFMNDSFRAAGAPTTHAQQMADLLVEADYRGHFSHGMNRLEMYVNDLQSGATDGAAVPAILSQTPATAWVDGMNGLGAVVGNYCTDLAIAKARSVGVGVVTARGSNHYGIAGWYAMRAQQQGLIGISMTNTSPLMVPTRGCEPTLGTNPLAFAAPANDGNSFVLDMATTAVALGKLEIQKRKGEALPRGWALNRAGRETTDANDAERLQPLGGGEQTSGYKGYGLAAAVETLCGVLAGAHFATNIRHWTVDGAGEPPNLGQFFMVIDPNCFAPGFGDRQSELNSILRNSKPVNCNEPVMLAGDPERNHQRKVDANGGIVYTANQLESCAKLASRLDILPLQFV